ncbi:MAG: T9SS type A sorting domain-containing protein [Bacteroidales bacterium]|nr:T9SS type A sorting domain-containing protein [Bacteroidales bacterium]
MSNIKSAADTPDDLLFLYPNPTSGALTISSSEPLQAFSGLILTNGNGQTVYGQKYLDNFTLSLPALACAT